MNSSSAPFQTVPSRYRGVEGDPRSVADRAFAARRARRQGELLEEQDGPSRGPSPFSLTIPQEEPAAPRPAGRAGVAAFARIFGRVPPRARLAEGAFRTFLAEESQALLRDLPGRCFTGAQAVALHTRLGGAGGLELLERLVLQSELDPADAERLLADGKLGEDGIRLLASRPRASELVPLFRPEFVELQRKLSFAGDDVTRRLALASTQPGSLLSGLQIRALLVLFPLASRLETLTTLVRRWDGRSGRSHILAALPTDALPRAKALLGR